MPSYHRMDRRIFNDMWSDAKKKTTAPDSFSDQSCEGCGQAEQTTRMSRLPDRSGTIHLICRDCLTRGIAYMRSLESQGMTLDEARVKSWSEVIGVDFDARAEPTAPAPQNTSVAVPVNEYV